MEAETASGKDLEADLPEHLLCLLLRDGHAGLPVSYLDLHLGPHGVLLHIHLREHSPGQGASWNRQDETIVSL